MVQQDGNCRNEKIVLYARFLHKFLQDKIQFGEEFGAICPAICGQCKTSKCVACGLGHLEVFLKMTTL